MDPRQTALLKLASIAGGVRGSTSEERTYLEVLVRDGYLRREDSKPLFPGKPKPLPVYRLTDLGSVIVKDESPTHF